MGCVTHNHYSMFAAIIASIAVMLASLSGVFLIHKRIAAWMHDNLSILVSFSAGVFLVVSISLGIESFEQLGTLIGTSFMLLGFVVIGIIFSLLPDSHHHHGSHCDHGQLDPRRILTSDALHNIGDGILIGVSFAVSPILGITSTLGVLIHEIVQEVSEFFVLRESGYSISHALRTNFLVSSTILLGTVLALFFIEFSGSLEAPLLAFSGGAFLYTVIKDLIPHSLKKGKEKEALRDHILWFLVGITIMLTLSSGDHEHGQSQNHSHSDAAPHTDNL